MKKGIHIPEPCHEDWDKMTPKDKGRFCQSCAKIVVDFTNMKKDEIIDHIESATGSTCGQFNNTQLDQQPMPEIIAPLPIKVNPYKYAAVGLLGVSMLASTVVEAQKHRPLRGVVAYYPPQVKENVKKTATVIEGIVTDTHANKSIPSANVQLLSGDKIISSTTTDADGKYQFNIAGGNIQDLKFTLVATHGAYDKKTIENIPVNKDSIQTNIDLGYGVMMLGMPVLMKKEDPPPTIKGEIIIEKNEVEINGEIDTNKEETPEKIIPGCKLPDEGKKEKEDKPVLVKELQYITMGSVAIVEHPITAPTDPEKKDLPEIETDQPVVNPGDDDKIPVKDDNVNNVIPPVKDKLISKLYPNPSVERAVLELNKKGTYDLELRDVMGKKVYNTSFKGNRFVLQLQRYVPGVYFVTVNSKETDAMESIQLVID
jgi:hypothetical protein